MKKLVVLLALLFSACHHQQNHFELPDAGYNQIDYHGGSILNNGINVYLIWYGNWTNSATVSIITDLVNGLNGSPYFNTNTTYFDYTGKYIENRIVLKASINDAYSHSSVISDADIYSIATDAINQGKLPADNNGIYFVLTSSDIDQTGGFCTQNCGWHSRTSLGNNDIKVAFVGDAGFKCQTNNDVIINGSKQGQPIDGDGDVLKGENVGNSCIAQLGISPNGSPAADGMASVFTHELSEATTDPDLDAWFYKDLGGECADKCAWNFGDTYKVANTSNANVRLGNRDFLIQQNWINVNGGSCALKY